MKSERQFQKQYNALLVSDPCKAKALLRQRQAWKTKNISHKSILNRYVLRHSKDRSAARNRYPEFSRMH